MQRILDIAAFPLIAGALGAGVAFMSKAMGAGAPEAIAIGAALFAGAVALRNYLEAQTDRPLLAEELTGLHDRVEVLQDDAADLRDLLTDLASIVEEAAARERDSRRMIEKRLEALEAEAASAAADGQLATMQSIQDAMGPLSDRLAQFDARTRKLALAIEKGLNGAESGVEAGLDDQPAPHVQSAAAARTDAPAETASTKKPQFDESPDALGKRYALMMQAVFSVPDGEPRFFEAYTRRIGADGHVAETADHIAQAKADGKVGEVDNLLLVRCVAAAEQLRSGGRNVAVFCNLSMQSLRDPAYLRAFTAFLRKNSYLSRYLVFEFDQTELDDFYDADIDILQRLRETGFVFSIDHLEDWSIDIANLAKIGFRYVKLDSQSLLDRESRGPGAIERLVRSFDRAGLSLVVEKVASVEDARRLEAAGARFLQGAGLAEPRLIRVDDRSFSELEQAARRAVSGGGGLEDRGGDGGEAPQAPTSAEQPEKDGGGVERRLSEGLERALEAVGRRLSEGGWPGAPVPARQRPD